MNTIKKITQLLLNESKFKDSLETNLANLDDYKYSSFYQPLDIDVDKHAKDVAEFVLVALTEMNKQDQLHRKQTGRYKYIDDNAASFNSIMVSIEQSAPLFNAFLNTYDRDGKRLEPVLNALENRKDSTIGDVLFGEMKEIYKEWKDIQYHADKYLKLQLGYVNPITIASIKNLETEGTFKAMMKDTGMYADAIFYPRTFANNREYGPDDMNYDSTGIVKTILREYSMSFNGKGELSENMYILSDRKGFMQLGVDNKENLVFKRLTGELLINGIPIDFGNTVNNQEEIGRIGTIIEVATDESFKRHNTNELSKNEAVILSMHYLNELSNQYTNLTRKDMNPEISLEILKQLASNNNNEHNSKFDLSESSKSAINNFAEKVRPDQLKSIDMLPIIRLIKYVGHQNVNSDHIDLWSNDTDSTNHSPTVKTVSSLVKAYMYEQKPKKELLNIAKSLSDYELILVESKLQRHGKDPLKFQNDLKQSEKNTLKP